MCITAATQAPVLNVLETVCRERKGATAAVGREIRLRAKTRRPVRLPVPGDGREKPGLGPEGPHQRENAACALGALGCLARQRV
ncbi:MAG: hypothetical protein MZV70_34490 [Desulfobacterales bacterium]|nr:hypothetical protein [Desulfobacterales bacterium]